MADETGIHNPGNSTAEPESSTQQNGLAYRAGRQQRRLRSAGAVCRVLLRVPLPTHLDGEPVTDQVVADRLATMAATHEALRTAVVVPTGRLDAVQLIGDRPTVTAHIVDGATSSEPDRLLELSCDALIADLATLQQVADVVCGDAADADDPIQFAEYAQWQDDLASEPADGSAEFWSSFADTVGTHLPDAVTSSPGPTHLQSARVGWAGLLCCALAILSGEETVAFGIEVDARRGEELAGAAGPFCEVLPMVVDIDPTDTLAGLARRCAAQLERLEHFQEWAPDSLPSTAPVVLGLGDGGALVTRPGADAELRVAADGSATVLDPGRELGADDRGPALDALCAVLRALTEADPESPIGELDVLDAAGLRPAEASTPAAAAVSVPDAIAAWAERTPERVALRARGATPLTYAELLATIGTTVERIAELSPSFGPIAVLADRSLGAVVGALAALWSGRGYLPLDAAQPPARLRAALDDGGCDLLLADSAADLANFNALDQRHLVVERIGPAWKPGGSERPPLPDAQSLAYVIFTSGSTGAAKGVEVTLDNLGAYVAGVRDALQLADGWNWALATLVSTDLGNTALFAALVGGGTLTVLDADEVLDPNAFAAALDEGQVDAVKITPTHLASLLDGERAPLPRELIVLGGETLAWTLVDRINAAGTVRIANHYGPTETTVGALAHEVTDRDDRSSASVPVGRPLPGARVALRTAGGARVPVGAAGELHIAGGGVARGYRGDPARTDEQFVTGADGIRYYRTGDIVRLRPDGEVEFFGRRDGQVKIRGYRVETGEIEAVLLGHPGVQRTAVVAVTTESAAALVAYFVSHYHPSPSATELREHLARTLPAHMVPTWFVELERLPLTGNGKLDRRALPEPTADLDQSVSYAEPENIIEVEIATIFATLLNQERVGRLDDFFRLGGHSLLATQVIMSIRHALAVDLPIQSIFLYPTVHALAGEIEARLMADIDGPAHDDLA